MELCTAHSVVSLQHRHRCLKPSSFHLRSLPLRRTLSPSSSVFQTTQHRVKSELRLKKLSLRATSEDIATDKVEYDQGTQDAGVAFEDAVPVEKIAQVEVAEPEKQGGENGPDYQSVSFELLDKLDVKLDTDSTIPLLLYGGGAIVTIWLTSAVVGAIDAIPVFPKLMQVVGIAYTIWFTSRYLIFKESREELSTKIAELKIKILGSEWN